MKLSHRKEVDGKAVVWCCGGYIEFRLAENMMDPRIRAKAIEKYHPRSVEGLYYYYRKEYEETHLHEFWAGFWVEPKYDFFDPRVIKVGD
ncbi:hypothetical protein HMPREF1986_00341 [Oribacterium sp. oral taxon 078 str. F0263]|uniref:hypothetical protein n=1 Tax=Oribacterium sp. oral taxon 078 TaxID=652706 RepID=UPI0003ADA88B|nr:hypothetical protein [Oribacterium sp. oral taxon 078]ERL22730.1 hypothetical protein HMPREF1986_00341 [Oribacterium sp. oral taxon 078 str. F0263]